MTVPEEQSRPLILEPSCSTVLFDSKTEILPSETSRTFTIDLTKSTAVG